MSTTAALVVLMLGAVAAVVSAWYKATSHGYNLHSRLRELQGQVDDMRRRKDEAYTERAHVLALLASVLQDSGEVSDNPNDIHKWRLFRGHDPHFKGWGTALYIEGPQLTGLGQMCWHFSDDTAFLVDCLGVPGHPSGWDGTPTAVKYDRIRRYVAGHGDEQEGG